MAPEVISRTEAKTRGLKRYFTGAACKHGHVALRITVNGICTECMRDIETRYRDSHREKFRAKWRANEKTRDPENRQARRKKWELANPGKKTAQVNRWKQANPDKVRAYGKKWRDANPENVQRKNKTYKTEHRDRLKPINDARTKQWRRDNPEKVWKLTNERRARKKNAPGSHTATQLVELLQRQNFQCVACGTSLETKRHLDHIVSLSRGGSNDISNLQWLCPSCNARSTIKTRSYGLAKRACLSRGANMAIDPEKHIIDPVTGFAVHKDSGHRIGLDNVPDAPAAKHVEYPKWVEPHDSHIVRTEHKDGVTISTPDWAQHHVARDGVITVFVIDEDEEDLASSPRKAK